MSIFYRMKIKFNKQVFKKFLKSLFRSFCKCNSPLKLSFVFLENVLPVSQINFLYEILQPNFFRIRISQQLGYQRDLKEKNATLLTHILKEILMKLGSVPHVKRRVAVDYTQKRINRSQDTLTLQLCQILPNCSPKLLLFILSPNPFKIVYMLCLQFLLFTSVYNKHFSILYQSTENCFYPSHQKPLHFKNPTASFQF